MIAHVERAHAHCSASGAERWLNCHGAPALEALVPEKETSKYAEEGTKAHELAEKMLTPVIFHWNKVQQLHDKVSSMMDFTIYDNYPRDMWEHVKGYVDTILEMVSHYKPRKVFIETKVTLFPQLQMYGTADCFFAFKDGDKKVLSVWDLKYGKGHVVEADSPQLIYYARAIQNQFPTVTFDEICLNIYQPRATHEEGAHRQHVLSGKEFDEWNQKFFQAGFIAMGLIGKSKKKIESNLKAGDHCGWCNAKAICPAYANRLNEKAGMDFMDDPTLLTPIKSEQLPELYDIDVNRLAAILKVQKEIESYLSNVKQVAINLILSGTDIPGFKVVEGRSTRKWRPEKGDVARGLKALGIDNPWDDKLRGLGSIETELKDKGMKAKEARAALDSLVEMSQPSFSLAPLDDPRPAIEGSEGAKRDFLEVVTED